MRPSLSRGIYELLHQPRSALGQATSMLLAEFSIVAFSRHLSQINARLPRPVVAQTLRQPPLQPHLVVESGDVDAAGVPVKYGVSRFAGAAVRVLTEP